MILNKKKMQIEENIILIKGFKLKENDHLFCNDYDFGHIDEMVEGKTFTLDCEESKLYTDGFIASDILGKVNDWYPIYTPTNKFFRIKVEKAFYQDAQKYVFRSFTVINQITCFPPLGPAYAYNNVGDCNTGKYNCGHYNTGDCNTGDCNCGHYNTGNCNTGDHNTGDRNKGTRNIGSENIGDYNVGGRNAGKRNIGNDNIGSNNIGSRNMGNYNLTDHSSGYFAIEEPKVTCFGRATEYTFSEFRQKFRQLLCDVPNFENLMQLPNANETVVRQWLEKYEELKNWYGLKN